MYKWLESRVLWGGLLILGGVLFLLQNLGIFEFGDLFWALLMALAGLFFISVYVSSRDNWWALIPGFTLLSIAFIIALGRLAPRLGDAWGGSIVLGGIGAGFLVVYLVDRHNWWALIPAGVMLTLTVITAMDQFLPGMQTGGIFFIGLGITFALLAVLPTVQGQPMKWAWIPAGVMLMMGVLISAASWSLVGYMWPLILILGGGYLVLRTLLPSDR